MSRGRLGLGLAALLAAHASSAGPARAWHTERERATDDTAYTMEGGSLRLGLFKLQWSPVDFVQLGTYTLPWAVLAGTAHAKLRLFQVDPFALALQAGFGYFDSSRLTWLDDQAGDAVITVLPLEALLSYRAGSTLSVSGGIVYTEVAVDGAIALAAFDGAIEGATDNLQLAVTGEIRLTKVFALQVHARWLVLQRVLGTGVATLHPDPFTTVNVHGDLSGEQFELGAAFSVVPALHVSWGVFNLRAGVGYGNYNVPLVNFVLPQRTPIPELDLFFVF